MAYKYKDMLAASSSELGKAIAEKMHPSVIETLYQRAKSQFLKDYPTCSDEWFKRINEQCLNRSKS
jgi:hypothetical protein